MRIVRRVLIGLVVLVVLLAVIGFLLPGHAHVERSIAINAPQDKVFALVNGYKRFNEFSPWAELDPSTQYSYEGPEQGVGAKMSWTGASDKVGSGSNEIVESTAPSLVRSRLQIEGFAQSEA